MSDPARSRERRIAVAFTFALAAYCAGIVAASSMSQPPGLAAVEQHVSDKVVHAAAFMGMALLAIGTARTRRPAWTQRAHLAIGVAYTVLFGVSDEIHQAFTPGRSPDVFDVAADTVGALVAAAIAFVVFQFHRTPGAD